MREDMNSDSITDAGRRIARTNERAFSGHRRGWRAVERVASLAGRWLRYLTVGLAVAWVTLFVVPAFSGMLAATVVGLGLVWLVPLAVVTGVVRVLETIEY